MKFASITQEQKDSLKKDLLEYLDYHYDLTIPMVAKEIGVHPSLLYNMISRTCLMRKPAARKLREYLDKNKIDLEGNIEYNDGKNS